MRHKKSKYPGRDIALDSVNINDAIRLLPKGHTWGYVRLIPHEYDSKPHGSAKCIDCSVSINYSQFDGKWWFVKDTPSLFPKGFNSSIREVPGCNEFKMEEALE